MIKDFFRNLNLQTKARSSVGERYIDTVEVDSSILSVPTIFRSNAVKRAFNVIHVKLNRLVFSICQNGRQPIYFLATLRARIVESLKGLNFLQLSLINS